MGALWLIVAGKGHLSLDDFGDGVSPPALSSTRSASPSTRAEKKCLRIVTYNIREGANGLHSELVKYLQETKADIVALQELNSWSLDSLNKSALQWGHEYVTFLPARTGYNLGMTSRLPFEVIRLRTEGFWHGMIHVKMLPSPETVPLTLLAREEFSDPFDDAHDDDEGDLGGIQEAPDPSLHIIITHLDPHSAENRFEEAHHVDRQSREHDRLILMGDMNALSSFDQSHYEEENLLGLLKRDPKLADKFLFLKEGANESEIDYRVMDKFYEEGRLQDLDAQLRDDFGQTVPSASNDDKLHAAPMRLDYILATSDMAASCRAARIDVTEATERISDHYPVIADFCF